MKRPNSFSENEQASKKRHFDKRTHWFNRVNQGLLPVEIWQEIGNHLDYLAYSRLSQVSVSNYHALSNLTVLAQKIWQEDPSRSRRGFRVFSIYNFLHDIRWSLLTDNWDENEGFDFYFQNMIRDSKLAALFQKSFDSTNISITVAGGYVRSLLIDFLRTHTQGLVANSLVSTYNDIDLWIDDESKAKLEVMELKKQFPGVFQEESSNRYLWNYRWGEINLQGILLSCSPFLHSYSWWDNKRTIPREKKILQDFDLSCCQFGLTKKLYRGFDCLVSPFGLWSLFSGTMVLQRDVFEYSSNPIQKAWFMELSDKEWELRCAEGWRPFDEVIWKYHDARRIFRIEKYLQRGHVFVDTSPEMMKRFVSRLQNVKGLPSDVISNFRDILHTYNEEDPTEVQQALYLLSKEL